MGLLHSSSSPGRARLLRLVVGGLLLVISGMNLFTRWSHPEQAYDPRWLYYGQPLLGTLLGLYLMLAKQQPRPGA